MYVALGDERTGHGCTRSLPVRSAVLADARSQCPAGSSRNSATPTCSAIHPDYNSSTGLRVTHTASESIHESIREEDRRRLRRLTLTSLGRKGSLGGPRGSLTGSLTSPPNSPLKPRRSLFSRASKGRKASLPLEEAGGYEATDGERAVLERQRTQANAAAEAQESARRQAVQDAKKRKQGLKGDKSKVKERRVVFVNLEGPKSDPRTYERNKVRTSKYTLVTFLPKVPAPPLVLSGSAGAGPGADDLAGLQNLSEQFRRVANIYFFLLIILQRACFRGLAS